MSKEFNPKCNMSTGTVSSSGKTRPCADLAAEAMQKHAAHRAEQAAYERALADQKAQRKGTAQFDRWVGHKDVMG